MTANDADKENKTRGLRHLFQATRYSLKGLRTAFRDETAFRQELFLCIFLLPASFFVGSSAIETAILIATLLLVLIVELINSAIEAAVDFTGTEFHPLAGKAKDLGSASVMIALILAGIFWFAMLYQNLLL